MIVKLEVAASEKIAARSQFEPNNYSVLISVDQLEVTNTSELLEQADNLFRRAKEAIGRAKTADGLGQPLPNGDSRAAQPVSDSKEHQASTKQLDLIHSLAKKAGMDDGRLREFAHQAVGGIDGLTKFDASRLINALQHAPLPVNGRAR
jgi:hypothetical protein